MTDLLSKALRVDTFLKNAEKHKLDLKDPVRIGEHIIVAPELGWKDVAIADLSIEPFFKSLLIIGREQAPAVAEMIISVSLGLKEYDAWVKEGGLDRKKLNHISEKMNVEKSGYRVMVCRFQDKTQQIKIYDLENADEISFPAEDAIKVAKVILSTYLDLDNPHRESVNPKHRSFGWR